MRVDRTRREDTCHYAHMTASFVCTDMHRSALQTCGHAHRKCVACSLKATPLFSDRPGVTEREPGLPSPVVAWVAGRRRKARLGTGPRVRLSCSPGRRRMPPPCGVLRRPLPPTSRVSGGSGRCMGPDVAMWASRALTRRRPPARAHASPGSSPPLHVPCPQGRRRHRHVSRRALSTRSWRGLQSRHLPGAGANDHPAPCATNLCERFVSMGSAPPLPETTFPWGAPSPDSSPSTLTLVDGTKRGPPWRREVGGEDLGASVLRQGCTALFTTYVGLVNRRLGTRPPRILGRCWPQGGGRRSTSPQVGLKLGSNPGDVALTQCSRRKWHHPARC